PSTCSSTYSVGCTRRPRTIRTSSSTVMKRPTAVRCGPAPGSSGIEPNAGWLFCPDRKLTLELTKTLALGRHRPEPRDDDGNGEGEGDGNDAGIAEREDRFALQDIDLNRR